MSHSLSFSLDIGNLEQTEKLGGFIGQFCGGGETIYLTGALGAGKTTLTQSIGSGLRIEKLITSPTFIIAKEYLSQNGIILLHADMYRCTSIEDLISTGIIESIGQKQTVTVIEWPEKIIELESYPHIHINLETRRERRKLSISLDGKNVSNARLFEGLTDEYTLH